MLSKAFNKVKWFLLGAIIFVVAGIIVRNIVVKQIRGARRTSTIARVEKGSLVQRVTIAGRVIPARKTLIKAPYNGYIKHLYVKVGQQVKTGDPVVSLVQSLIAGEDVFPMRSPFPGTVVQVRNQAGEYVQENDQKEYMVRIDDLSELFVEANVPEVDRLKIQKGQEAVIKASSILDRAYTGTIVDVALASMESDDWSQRGKVEFPVKIKIQDADERVHPGMSTIIDIIANKADGILTLRHEFIQKIGDEYFVVLESGEKKPIQVGIQNEEMFEIRSGLKEGDRVKQTDFYELFNETKG